MGRGKGGSTLAKPSLCTAAPPHKKIGFPILLRREAAVHSLAKPHVLSFPFPSFPSRFHFSLSSLTELSRLIIEGAVCAVLNSDQHLISPYCRTVYKINHNDWKNKWIDYKRGKCLELYTHYFQQYHTNCAENTVENRSVDNSTFKKRIRWILCNFHYILVMSKLEIPYNSVFQTLMSL